MSALTIAELRKKNDDLRQLVIRLGTIILRNAVEHRELVAARGSELGPRLLAATTPVRTVDRLREIALRCNELSRDCRDTDASHALEGLSAQLATEAETLEVLLRIAGANE
jgi:hypothetical protein